MPYITAQFFGGTSLLIIVGVILDTMRQVETHLIQRHYDGFLRKGRIRGRFDRTPDGPRRGGAAGRAALALRGHRSLARGGDGDLSRRQVSVSEAADRLARTARIRKRDAGGNDSSHAINSRRFARGDAARGDESLERALGLAGREARPAEGSWCRMRSSTSWLSSGWHAHDGAFVFDGYPRSVGQAEALERLLAKRERTLEIGAFARSRSGDDLANACSVG